MYDSHELMLFLAGMKLHKFLHGIPNLQVYK
jgi:hypothetical protein